ncbi:hypothetical protein BDZ85DRAFT_303225 [Elsinoe ampelina]|uniref:DUF7580 domain-containing protein n=1 Tax=Elsinoe ampelina TaxID=302913 RepID=A0A6A6G2X7_9PEZI|nr:hypothetical protein BDZ85DRAFT_303225 [Elsinoe ampelina]
MSGLEVVGVVFGAIPLIISALEHYEAINDKRRTFRHFGQHLANAIVSLHAQYASFEYTIRLLLLPVTSNGQLDEMLHDASCRHWSDQGIEDGLRERLGNAYPQYRSTMVNIQQQMIEIAAKLDGLSGADDLTKVGLKAIIERQTTKRANNAQVDFVFSNRLKFTMSKDRIQQATQRLERDIDMLDKIQSKADKLVEATTEYRTPSKSRLMMGADIIRANAEKLYSVLSDNYCTLHNSHATGLLLEQRLATKGPRKQPRGRGATFQSTNCDPCCFGMSIRHAANLSADKWLDVEVRLPPELDQLPAQNSKVKVKITAVPSMSPLSNTLPYHNVAQLQIVDDICSQLQSACHPCVGFCVDDQGRLRGAYNAQRAIQYTKQNVSLEDILQSRPNELGFQDRYHLAITLTATLLQLSHTSWLSETLSKADLLFLRAKQGSALNTEQVDIKHPYLSHEHSSTQVGLRPASNLNDNFRIAILGVILLEIYERRSLDDPNTTTSASGPQDQLSIMTRCLNAQKYWQEHHDQVSKGFSHAIKFCLKCLMEPGADLKDQDFARTVEQEVLIPLEDEMATYFNIP